jgi:hypothetical protein
MRYAGAMVFLSARCLFSLSMPLEHFAALLVVIYIDFVDVGFSLSASQSDLLLLKVVLNGQ